MLVAVASGVGLSYFSLGWVSNIVSVVSFLILKLDYIGTKIYSAPSLLIAKSTSATSSASAYPFSTKRTTPSVFSLPASRQTLHNSNNSLAQTWRWS